MAELSAVGNGGVWKWVATLLAGFLGGLLPTLYVNAQKPTRDEVRDIVTQEMRVMNQRLDGFEALLSRTEIAVDRARSELLAEIRKEPR